MYMCVRMIECEMLYWRERERERERKINDSPTLHMVLCDVLQIKQLQDKINNRFEVSRDTIVNVLCRCDMVVDEAYYSLQRDALSELYAHMTTEYSEITEGVAEMEFLKKSVVARMESDDEVKTQVGKRNACVCVCVCMHIHNGIEN